jgi:hypothetical protein
VFTEERQCSKKIRFIVDDVLHTDYARPTRSAIGMG